MKDLSIESEKKNISTIIYIAIGCLFFALLIAATIYSQTTHMSSLPLADVYIVEERGIDYTYYGEGIIDGGNLIVTLDFTINFMDQLLLAAISPGSEASLSSDDRVSAGTVIAIEAPPEGEHGANIKIAPNDLIFQDGEAVDVAIYCIDIRMNLPIVPSSALVRSGNEQSTQYHIYLLDIEYGPWGMKNVVVQKQGVIAWPEYENAEYVFLIGVEVDKPVVLGVDSGFLLDGMEVRTPRGFSFDYDIASLSNNMQQNAWNDDGASTTYPVKEGLSGTLVISSHFWFLPEMLAYNFMQIYPDVNIIVDSADGYSLDAFTEFASRLRVQLMSGENAPDIINMGPSLDLISAANNGMIIDLYPFWMSDPDIIQNDYFTNIIELYKHNGGLYAIPSSFAITANKLNKRVTDPMGIDVDSFDAISASELLDIYLSALDKGIIDDDFNIVYGDPAKHALLWYVLSDFFDPATKTARFNTPEFIELLEKSNKIPVTQTVFTGYTTSGILEDFVIANNAFIYTDFLWFMESESVFSSTPDTSHNISVLTPGGSLPINPGDLWAISSSCKNPELAWEFIKYCIMESEGVSIHRRHGEWNGDRWMSYIPINRNNFRKRLLYASASTNEYTISIEDETRLLELFDRINTRGSDNALIYEMNFLDILTLYFDMGLITAEECARQLQERAEIYFGE